MSHTRVRLIQGEVRYLLLMMASSEVVPEIVHSKSGIPNTG